MYKSFGQAISKSAREFAVRNPDFRRLLMRAAMLPNIIILCCDLESDQVKDSGSDEFYPGLSERLEQPDTPDFPLRSTTCSAKKIFSYVDRIHRGKILLRITFTHHESEKTKTLTIVLAEKPEKLRIEECHF